MIALFALAAAAAIQPRPVQVPVDRFEAVVEAAKEVCPVSTKPQDYADAALALDLTTSEHLLLDALCVSYWHGRYDGLDQARRIVEQMPH
jgi:hypothetical protein